MKREQWTEAGLEIAEHLQEINRIAKQNGIDSLSIAIFSNGNTWATYVNEESDQKYEVDTDPSGRVALQEDGEVYYVKS